MIVVALVVGKMRNAESKMRNDADWSNPDLPSVPYLAGDSRILEPSPAHIIIIIIIIVMEKTEAGLRGFCIREIDVKSQILVHRILK